MGYVRETAQIKKKKKKRRSQHGMYKRNSPQKSKSNMGCVRDSPDKEEKRRKEKKKKEKKTNNKQTKPARDV